ncbi:MAG: anaerobic sulfatase maturase [Actinomycetota bacterium]
MNPPRHAFHLLAKPTSATCNLDCKYCFFLSKDELYPGRSTRMGDDVLRAYVTQLLEAQPDGEVNVAWQGGEPTLMGIDFFEQAVALAEAARRPAQQLLHTIQTNGTLLDDAWVAFFVRHRFLVGLSIDGPAEIHDRFRVTKNGRGTHAEVIRAWNLLRAAGVETNILCSVSAANSAYGLEVYRYFRDELGAEHIQFIPIVERATEATLELAERGWSEQPGRRRILYTQSGSLTTSRSVTGEGYGRFLIDVFDEWVRHDVGQVYVQLFDVTLGNHLGLHSLCVHSPECGAALAIEHNGDVYSCDHFVEPDHLLGNVMEQPLAELVVQPQQVEFGRNKATSLPQQCRDCDVLFACHGGCPKDRFATTASGEPGLNHLCGGYLNYFRYSRSSFAEMARLLQAGRYADEIMTR